MAKKLRLIVAELTDVGRKRERNQDNVAHHVPSDDETLERRGALFVVCDGMGGHAAGEVASQMAIQALREAYYASREQDIISALAYAVDRANTAIFGHALERPELTGMGTTCVAAVLSGGRAYIVNVGDSRAYLIRQGKMRQITQDHSWVAEQVRVGLLTEEQARSHSHRNVITRSLGHQPTVTADLFIETVRDGDRLLLCSDGLHGYVGQMEIEHEVVAQEHPDTSVHHLVDLANANGGPDNVTALVVHLIEVPEPSALVLPPALVPSTPAGMTEERTTEPVPIVTAKAATPAGAKTKPAASGAKTATAVKERPATQKRSRGARIAFAALQIAALLAIASGAWYYFFGPAAASRTAAQRLQADLAHARQTVTQSASQDPASALVALAHDRQVLLADLNSSDTDAQTKQQIQDVLDKQLVPAVQTAVQRYNADARIRVVPAGSAISYADSAKACTAPGATGSAPLAKVGGLLAVAPPAAGKPAGRYLYVLDAGVVFELIAPLDDAQAPKSGTLSCVAVIPSALAADITNVAAIAGEGSTLYALSQHANGSYSVIALTSSNVKPDGSLDLKAQPLFNVPIASGQKPTHLAAQGGSFYVSYEQGTDAGLWIFSGDTSKGPARQISLPRPANSLAISGGALYLLMADGAIAQLDSAPAFKALVVNAPAPLQPLDATSYVAATPVPAPPAATATTGTHFAGSAALGLDPANPSHLLVGDAASARVTRFVTGSGGANPSLAAQYVYDHSLQGASPFATASASNVLYVYIWAQDHLAVFAAPGA